MSGLLRFFADRFIYYAAFFADLERRHFNPLLFHDALNDR